MSRFVYGEEERDDARGVCDGEDCYTRGEVRWDVGVIIRVTRGGRLLCSLIVGNKACLICLSGEGSKLSRCKTFLSVLGMYQRF